MQKQLQQIKLNLQYKNLKKSPESESADSTMKIETSRLMSDSGVVK